jgi:hypothetical protein
MAKSKNNKKNKNVAETHVEAASVETPVNVAPVETPVNVAPVETPVNVAPVETPVNVAPVNVAPVETPVNVAPVNVAPVETSVNVVPVETSVNVVPVKQSGGKTRKSKKDATKVQVENITTVNVSKPDEPLTTGSKHDETLTTGSKPDETLTTGSKPDEPVKKQRKTYNKKVKTTDQEMTTKNDEPVKMKKEKKVKTDDNELKKDNIDELEKRVRSFKVKLPNKEDYEGRFTGLTPYQAANKALSKYFRETEQPMPEITFSIYESTRKSKNTVYTYIGMRHKLDVPVSYKIQDGREIVKNFKNTLKKVKKDNTMLVKENTMVATA